MIVTLQTQRVQTLDQVRAFVEGSEAVDFAGGDRAGVYTLVRRTLVKLNYHRLSKADKGLVKRYLTKVTGLSRAQRLNRRDSDLPVEPPFSEFRVCQ